MEKEIRKLIFDKKIHAKMSEVGQNLHLNVTVF